MAFINTAEAISCYWIGQVTIKQLEKFLWLLEKCSQWSLPPADETEKDSNTLIRPQLTRPLPWVLFLPTLMMLRMWRETISFTAVLRGGEPYTAAQMVKNIQNSRRTLRAVKYHGIRYRRLQKQLPASADEDNDSDILNNWAKWFNNLIFFKSIEYRGKRQAVESKKDKQETDSKNEEDPVTRKKRQLSIDEDKVNGRGEDDGEDEWEDDGEEEDDEDAFNPDAALKELATKIEELATDTEDSDYSGSSGDLDTTAYSVSAEEEETEENGIADVEVPAKNGTEIQQNGNEKTEVKDENFETESENNERKDDSETLLKVTKEEKEKVETEEVVKVNIVDSKKKNKKIKSYSKSNINKQNKKGESKVDVVEQTKEQNAPTLHKADSGNMVLNEDLSITQKETEISNRVIEKSQDKLLDINNEQTSQKDVSLKSSRDVSQVEHPSQKIHTSLPIFKAESQTLAHPVHKSQPIKHSNGNSEKNFEAGEGTKSVMQIESESFIQGEKSFNFQTAKTTSKQSDVSEASMKHSVRDRVHLKTKANKNSLNSSAIDNNGYSSYIYKMKVNTVKENNQKHLTK